MANGTHKSDRTGTGTRSVFGRQLRFDLATSFPLITTKRVHFKSVAVELLWFLRGDSNVKWMQDQGVTIWDEWADADGELGPVYGVQWRSWPTPDIASYALLTRMVAQQAGLEPGEFIWTGGDVHVYDNHVDQVAEQLSREPYAYPQLKILRKPDSIFDYTLEDFEVVDYRHHPTIKAPIAV